MSKKFLLICWFNDSVSPKAVLDHIFSFQHLSHFTIDVYNTDSKLLYTKKSLFQKSPRLVKQPNLNKYTGFIVHSTASYNPDYLESIKNNFRPALDEFNGVKILLKQDEIFKTNLTLDLIERWQFNLLFSCVPEHDLDTIYPPSRFPKLKKIKVLTGYVTEEMRKLDYTFEYNKRSLDVAYRGMKLPYYFGRLSYEKYEIGERFNEYTKEYKLKTDISSKLEDRIYGKKWFEFLASSKAVLGVESGASIYDFTGEVKVKTEAYLEKHPDASFEQATKDLLHQYDNKLIYNAISPRHFEAAAVHTVQILYEGCYENIFTANKHYIMLKKDFSNIEDVINKLHCADKLASIANSAYHDIIMNEKYTFNSFIDSFDQQLGNII